MPTHDDFDDLDLTLSQIATTIDSFQQHLRRLEKRWEHLAAHRFSFFLSSTINELIITITRPYPIVDANDITMLAWLFGLADKAEFSILGNIHSNPQIILRSAAPSFELQLYGYRTPDNISREELYRAVEIALSDAAKKAIGLEDI